MRAIYLYTGADGHSHFKEGYIHNHTHVKTTTTTFVESPAFSKLYWHTAPQTQFVVTLKGTLEFTVHSGQSFVIKPGTILIADDTTGSGHYWKLIDSEPWQRVYAVFAEPLLIETIFKEIL
ncbi:hypothetical protein K5I29_05740 [Flavobacterium agricola]|uniref:AraC-type arabinose-binding/dimerisation domain-containing protein n=1 Tax=Flavobacterium agricola TaxID=2870839 RepID=A0ABY6M1I6_9FLAO|nr:hypothetical protein [Flavobacterium agricola]UYW02396.1 hypothetical protein K5I29_05740 [Flavobacterium agricola]